MRNEEGNPVGEELLVRTARRFLNNPNILKANYEPHGDIWNYHLRRTGIQHPVALQKGLEWLRAQPNKADAPAAATPEGVKRGAEA